MEESMSESERVFVVNPQTGLRIRDILEDNEIYSELLEQEWQQGKLQARDIGNWKYYNIYYVNHDNEVYLRPFKEYHCKNFEDTFGFGSHCDGFTENKIIRIRNFE